MQYYGSWGVLERFGVRFGVIFGLVYGMFEGFNLRVDWLRMPTPLMMWQTYTFGRRIPIPVEKVAGNLIMAGVSLAVAIVGGLIWTALQRRRKYEWELI